VWHKATRSSAVGPQPRPAHPVGQRGDRLGDQRRGVRAHVTGASSGIGAATARLLHKAGAHPVLAARRADRLTVLSEELDGALAVPTDVTDPTAVRRLAETTLDRHGRIDGLVNNAGVSLHTPLDLLDLDEFARVLQLNVISSSGVRRQCRPARATPKRSASPRAAAATGTSAASSSAAALTRSACAAEALPALFAVLIATKLIGAAERASVQDRLRSLPRLRQASATLPTCASSIPCSVTSGRTAGWVACHRRPWSVPLDLPCRSA
jgi:NAD(P)-dependent dehydrogenase (short-subunit alcohol dehydrogenase family)